MSIAQIVTRGYGTFGSVNRVVTRGYEQFIAVQRITTTDIIQKPVDYVLPDQQPTRRRGTARGFNLRNIFRE